MSVQTQITRILTDRNTIRTKLNNFGLVELTANLDDCASAIEAIANNGGVKANVKEGETYTIPAGYHDGSGIISGIAGGGNYSLLSKSTTPTKTRQSITADDGYYGLSDVTVEAIPTAYQDVSNVTTSAADVLSTKVFVDANGKETTGTMANRGAVNVTLSTTNTSYTVPAGYHNGSGTVKIVTETKTVTPTTSTQQVAPTDGKVLSQVTVNPIPSTFANTTDATVTAAQILYGQTAYGVGVAADGTTAIAEKITGTMANNGKIEQVIDTTTTSYTIPEGYTTGGTVSMTLEAKTATPTTKDQSILPSSGKVLSGVTVKAVNISLPAANTMLDTATATVSSNGTTLGTVTGTITSKAATTYYPKTTDQSVAAGVYLSGALTFKAVTTSGIDAANIKHGVTINVGDAANNTRIATATGTFYNDGTTYTLTKVGTTIDMGATSSNRYITTSGLQVIPTALYTASGVVTNEDITTYGKLTIAEAITTENVGVLTTGTTPTYTQGTVSVSAGWITAGTIVSGATFSNTASSSVEYKDISNTSAAPILTSGDYLYINAGYTDNVKISLAKLVPDKAVVPTDSSAFMLSGYSAYDSNGTLLSGSIASLAASTYYTSSTDLTIAAGKYLSGAQTIKAVTTSGISASNIRYGSTVKVGDSGSAGRIANVAGTFTSSTTVTSGQTAAAAGLILSKYSAWVDGTEVLGTMTNNGALSLTFNALTQTSIDVPSGYTTGGTVTLTDDLEKALAEI